MEELFAFPSSNDVSFGEFVTTGHAGMTLRDYFAAKAMQAMLSEGFIPQQHGIDYKSLNGAFHDLYASQSYKMADAMLEARKK